jgi:hypothetical protein
MTEVILCNVRIVTYHIDTPLQKHFELPGNEILVFVPLFLNKLLKHSKKLFNKVEIRRV